MEAGNKNSLVLRAEGVCKYFGGTRALNSVSIVVGTGELVGIAGHNGAGKSTLLRIVCGLLRPDEGQVQIGQSRFSHGLSVKQARVLGVRAVHQELSLCAGLRVDESAAVIEGTDDRAPGWRRRAWGRLEVILDGIFPGHGITASQHIGNLSIARRQMVEIAGAALPGSHPATLFILDEPTSSLDEQATEGLYRWLREKTLEGISCIVTTHRLNEMLTYADRIYVMRDGEVTAEQRSRDASREQLVNLMAGAPRSVLAAEEPLNPGQQLFPVQQASTTPNPVRVSITHLTGGQLDDVSLEVKAGEIIGIAGLEGHGQRPLLEAIFRTAMFRSPLRRARHVEVSGKVAYVSGDRAVAGVFKYWDVAANISVSSLGKITHWGYLVRSAEARLAATWAQRLQIRGTTDMNIESLSGGNQQKVMAARAIATGATVFLLDDPTRGVDQETKDQLYSILREEAGSGKCFLWYSTENEELVRCDRVYVMRSGSIVETLEGADRDPARIVAASFQAARRDG